MDDETRNGALQKARLMDSIIGFPDKLYNDITMDSFSLNLDINSNSHFQNILNTQHFNFDQHLSTLHNFTDNSFEHSHTEVNAYYLRKSNIIGKHF